MSTDRPTRDLGSGRHLRQVLLVVLTVAVVSCASDSPSLDDRLRAANLKELEEAKRLGWTDAAAALEDGRLTDAEYARLFSLYRECMGKLGVDLADVVKSPADGRSLLHTEVETKTLGAEVNDATFECLVRFREGADLAVADQPGPMAEPLRAAVTACLRRGDVRTGADDRTLRDLVTTAGREAEPQIRDCVDASMRELYPGMPITYSLPVTY